MIFNKSKLSIFFVFLTSSFLSGCATTNKEQTDFGENWAAINTYTDKIEVLPRFRTYILNATQLDGTLINLISRWAMDLDLKMQLNCKNDFSLPKNIITINEDDVTIALAKINTVYKEQFVNVQLSSGVIIFDCNLNDVIIQSGIAVNTNITPSSSHDFTYLYLHY
jgi:hypothetical protein